MPDLRKFIALLFAVLLPLQTLASMAMPLQVAAQAAVPQDAHCPGHAGDATHDQPVPNNPVGDQGGFGHLVCAGVLRSAKPPPAGMAVSHAFAAVAELQPVSHTPEEPNPPPVATRS